METPCEVGPHEWLPVSSDCVQCPRCGYRVPWDVSRYHTPADALAQGLADQFMLRMLGLGDGDATASA